MAAKISPRGPVLAGERFFVTEPSLQPVTGEQFSYLSANVEDGSRVDVVAEGFWNLGQKA